jgi:hypothetical protein
LRQRRGCDTHTCEGDGRRKVAIKKLDHPSEETEPRGKRKITDLRMIVETTARDKSTAVLASGPCALAGHVADVNLGPLARQGTEKGLEAGADMVLMQRDTRQVVHHSGRRRQRAIVDGTACVEKKR